jgi:Fe-S-cluster containining protein
MSLKKRSLWYVAGLHFECLGCGQCCSGPEQGFIWITQPEIELAAEFLKITTSQFKKQYLRRVGHRTTIIEHDVTNDCIFLRKIDGKKKCVIYPVRPNQCRTWPFWSSNLLNQNEWNETAKRCSGINRGKFYSFEEIQEIKKSRKWWKDE